MKNIRDVVFHLIKLRTKGLKNYWKETPAYAFSKEFHEISWKKKKYLLKITIAAPDKSSEAAVRNDVFQNDVLKYFALITKKPPVSGSLFNKVAGLKACNTIKKRLQHRHLPVINKKVLISAFATEHLWCLLLNF